MSSSPVEVNDVALPDVISVAPEQLEAECAIYPTVDICEGAVNVGVSVPMVLTVKAPDEGGHM